jgi:hypothetical protein
MKGSLLCFQKLFNKKVYILYINKLYPNTVRFLFAWIGPSYFLDIERLSYQKPLFSNPKPLFSYPEIPF